MNSFHLVLVKSLLNCWAIEYSYQNNIGIGFKPSFIARMRSKKSVQVVNDQEAIDRMNSIMRSFKLKRKVSFDIVHDVYCSSLYEDKKDVAAAHNIKQAMVSYHLNACYKHVYECYFNNADDEVLMKIKALI